MPSVNELIFGGKDRNKRRSVYTPEQQKLLKDYISKGIETSPLYGAGSDFLQSLLSNEPGAFEAFEAPYKRQFEQEIAPGIAERFAGMGTGGSLASSGLNNSLARAATDLQTNLASLRGNLQLGALPQALAYAQQPYSNQAVALGQRSFENVYQPGSIGLLGEAVKGVAGGFAGGFGNQFGLNTFGPKPGIPGA